MKWTFDEAKYGDIIRVKNGSIYHYGIYVSDDEIIQFGLPPSARFGIKDTEVSVCTSDIDAFLCGAFLEVAIPEKKDLKTLRSPEITVATARSRIGEKGYNILYNNCEHFVYECAMGVKYCSQTENVRAMFQAIPILDVYVAKIPQNVKISSVYPIQINKEIANCLDKQEAAQKFCAWKLLEYALERTFEKKIIKLSFSFDESGKPICSEFEFSISYCDDAVAVAVSKKLCNIYIKKADETDNSNFETLQTVILDNAYYSVKIENQNLEKLRLYNNIDLTKL